MWDLSSPPGIKPATPAVEAVFPTGPLGKFQKVFTLRGNLPPTASSLGSQLFSEGIQTAPIASAPVALWDWGSPPSTLPTPNSALVPAAQHHLPQLLPTGGHSLPPSYLTSNPSRTPSPVPISSVLISFLSCSVSESCLTLCDPMKCTTLGFPVLHHLPKLSQTHVHSVIDAIQPPRHLLSPFPLPSIFPTIRVFSDESALRIRWPKHWNFSFSACPSNEYSGLISFRID